VVRNDACGVYSIFVIRRMEVVPNGGTHVGGRTWTSVDFLCTLKTV